MLSVVLIQVVLPLALIGLLALRRGRDRTRLALDAALVALYLVALALAGLWLALPRWLVGVYAVLLLGAAALGAARLAPDEERGPAGPGPKGPPWIRLLAVGCVGALALLAVAGRRPPPGTPVALDFPIAGGPYQVATGGSSTLLNPHLKTLDEGFRAWRGQSYAVDLVGVGAWGSRASPTLSPELHDFVAFGRPVRAPCAGRVVRAEDGAPDVLPPGEAPASLEGNHVILECGEVWVLLAHLARGSVEVAAGDTVSAGDPLGRVGNSGRSDEPHLHIHAQTPGTESAPLSGAPLPITFEGRHPARNDRFRGPPGRCEDRDEGAGDQEDDRATAARVRAELEALRAAYDFPGAVAAWSRADGGTGVAATGLADLDSGRAMPPDARMLAASVGKSFVAATVLAMAAEGTLDLDEPVRRWLGGEAWFARLPNGPSITIRHLLTHTSGLADHVYDPAFRARWAAASGQPATPLPPPDSLVVFVLDDPPRFPPGEGWAYTDTGYLLLGMVVERASGRTVFDQIRARFLGPLGLSRTSPSDRRTLPGLVPGYVAEGNPYGLPTRTMSAEGTLLWDPAVEGAGGGLVSHPLDLVRWARALFEGTAMDVPYLDELLAAAPEDGSGGERAYGAGVSIRHSGPLGPVWGHAGSLPGYLSSMRYYPRQGTAVAFQINSDGRFAEGVEPGEVMEAMELRLARAVTLR